MSAPSGLISTALRTSSARPRRRASSTRLTGTAYTAADNSAAEWDLQGITDTVVANAFHSFYHAVPVIQAERRDVRDARLRLVAAAKQAIRNALTLLDIHSPEVM